MKLNFKLDEKLIKIKVKIILVLHPVCIGSYLWKIEVRRWRWENRLLWKVRMANPWRNNAKKNQFWFKYNSTTWTLKKTIWIEWLMKQYWNRFCSINQKGLETEENLGNRITNMWTVNRVGCLRHEVKKEKSFRCN
jgi:hypothetical protein